MSKEDVGFNKVVGYEDVFHNRNILRQFVAEFVGTLILVFVGVGACATFPDDSPSADKIVRIALAFGLTVATLAESIGHVSGCHINPAVTCGLMFNGQCSLLKAIVYIFGQCTGAIIGALLIVTVASSTKGSDTLGVTNLGADVTIVQGIIIEAIITFVLVLIVCAICDEERNPMTGSAGLAIGLSITACHLFAIPYTGSSMNPARSLGPAIIQNLYTNFWIYWVGPLLGAAVAGSLYKFLFKVQYQRSVVTPTLNDRY